MNQKKLGAVTLYTVAALIFSTISSGAMTMEGVDIHGFVSQGFICSDEYNYITHNSTDGSFEYNEFGLNFSKHITDRFRMGLQFLSRDLGDVSNNKVTVDWAYGDYRFTDWLGFRAGRIKMPMGFYNETRDVDMLRTCIIMPQGIYNDLIRDNLIAMNGVGLYGNLDLRVAGLLEYQTVTGAIHSDADSGVNKWANSGMVDYGTQIIGDMQNDTAFAGAIRWETPLSGLRLGYSYYSTKPSSQIGFNGSTVAGTLEATYKQHVGSAEFIWNDLTVAAEYMTRKLDAVFGPISITSEMETYYLSASYMFTDWFTLGAYYEIIYPEKDDKNGDNLAPGVPDHRAWQKELAVTLRFDINEYWIIKFEGHAVDGTGNVIKTDNSDNDFSASDWYYGAAKATFSF